jgi:hypothetical protein
MFVFLESDESYSNSSRLNKSSYNIDNGIPVANKIQKKNNKSNGKKKLTSKLIYYYNNSPTKIKS